MLALIILNSTLFLYIRIHSGKLRKASSTSEQTLREVPSYENNLKVGKATERRPSQPVQSSASHQAQQRMKNVSLTLLCYPIVYLILLLPLSIARLKEFSGKNPSLNATYFAAAVFDCQGFINVLLYTSTRKGIVSWDSLFRKIKRRTPNVTAVSGSRDPTTSQCHPPVPGKPAYIQYEGRRSSDATYKKDSSMSDSLRNSDDKLSVDSMA
jgi:G protein-coupled glucose receptor regulating Gpa2 C-term